MSVKILMKLMIASRNSHKIEEIKAIFQLPSVEWLGLDSFPPVPDVVEDGKTFDANAVKKAVTLALQFRVWALADDSGLEVDALAGAPGVYSARYAGEQCDYAANNTKLLQALQGCSERSARFRCVVALAAPDGRAQLVEGICAGRITEEVLGQHGFGYDPVFIPQGYEQTFAEMEPALKNSISHRARALARARDAWGAMLSQADPVWPLRP